MITIPPDIELKGWGNNANKVTFANLQLKAQEGT
jgi:hypothetical protein